jgi:phosphatidylglycerophosphatase C
MPGSIMTYGDDVSHLRRPNLHSRPVVAFDFDGTLTCRDSFMAFLIWREGPARFALKAASLAPAILAYFWTQDRGRLKSAMIRRFLRGVSRANLEDGAARYANHASGDLFRPDAVRCWEDWGRRGAWRVIVTASPEDLVAPFAARLGADDLIGSRLAFDHADRVTGDLLGRNCRGPEKVARLQAAYGDDLCLDAAYGDSDGDREMLAIARQPGLRVFSARP